MIFFLFTEDCCDRLTPYGNKQHLYIIQLYWHCCDRLTPYGNKQRGTCFYSSPYCCDRLTPYGNKQRHCKHLKFCLVVIGLRLMVINNLYSQYPYEHWINKYFYHIKNDIFTYLSYLFFPFFQS